MRGWSSCQIFKKGIDVVAGSQFLEGVAGKEWGDLFQRGCSFYMKIKLKSEIYNDKKSLKTKMFRVDVFEGVWRDGGRVSHYDGVDVGNVE